jgi:two-component system chemotaxis response regulator CheB
MKMQGHDVIAIGASAGGLAPLKEIVRGLPPDLPAAVFVVIHTHPRSPGFIAGILEREGQLPASNAVNGEEILKGHIYVAPPDRHLVIEDGRVLLSQGPKENRMRPAVDPLLRSAAHEYRQRVVGVILSGNLDDGTSGLWSVKRRGGVAVVQDPREAECSEMPRSAIRDVKVDYCLPAAEIAPLLVRLARDPANEGEADETGGGMEIEMRIAKNGEAANHDVERLGEPSAFTCPECHGAFREIHEGELVRFRCRTGHAYTAASLFEELSESVEDEIWDSIRALEEFASLAHLLADQAHSGDDEAEAERFRGAAREAERRAGLLRQALPAHEVLA